MKHVAAAVALAVALGFAGCGRKQTAPPPMPPSPPPVAPATPPPAPPPVADVEPVLDEYERLKAMASDEIDRMGLLKDIRFDLDTADIRDADRQVLADNAAVLKKFDFLRVTIEGHCDERGSVDYNLALGERRARAANDYLVSLGIDASRLKMVSLGKEFPACTQSNEDCWARNRRDHFAVTGKVR